MCTLNSSLLTFLHLTVPANRPGGWSEANRFETASPDQKIFGFLLERKRTGIPAASLLLVVSMVGIGGLAGVVAAGVLLSLTNNGAVPPYQLAIGAAIGAISSSVWSLQIVLIYIFHNFVCHLYLGTGHLVFTKSVEQVVLALLTLASTFARTLLPTIYTTGSVEIEGQYPMICIVMASI